MSKFLSAELDQSWLTSSEPHHLIFRPSLLDSLYQHRNAKVRALIAPKGSGKTTLLQQYYGHYKDQNCAWMSLGQQDISASQFFQHLSRAIQQIIPEFNAHVICHELLGHDAKTLILTSFFLDAIDQLRHPITLIIDNIQYLDSARWQRDFYDLIQQSNNIRWILAGQRKANLRFDGKCESMRPITFTHEELYFSDTEIRRFLNQNSINNTYHDLVVNVTQGWPAGVKLAQLCLTNLAEPLSAEALPGRTLFIYLINKIIDNLSPELQKLLVETAFLERFNTALCQHVVKGLQTPSLIQELLDTRFFLKIHPEHSLCYEYSELVKEQLKKRFNQLDPEYRNRLIARACSWLSQENFRIDAYRTAACHNQPQFQQETVLYNIVCWLRCGDLNSLYQCLAQDFNAFSHDSLTLPQTQSAWCWMLTLSGRTTEAEKNLTHLLGDRQIHSVLQNPADATEANYAVMYGLIKSIQNQLDDGIIGLLQQLLNHPQIYTSLRSTLHCLLAEIHVKRYQFEAATNYIEQARKLALDMNYEYCLAVATYQQAKLCYLNNDVEKASTLCGDLLQQTRQKGTSIETLGLAIQTFLWYRSKDKKAAYELSLSLCGSCSWLPPEAQMLIYQPLLRYKIEQRQIGQAKALLLFLHRIAQASGSEQFMHQVVFERCRMAVALGDQTVLEELAATKQWQRLALECKNSSIAMDWSVRESVLLCEILYHLQCLKLDTATNLATDLLYLNVECGYPVRYLPISALVAWLDFRNDNKTAAYRRLNDVLSQADRSGIYYELFDDIPNIAGR
jgi:LuxR family maltose regulon positive regulatory protein